VAYDWDLDEVLQRQMEEALGQAGLDDSYSDESGEGDEERDASVTGKKASLDRCASGYDQDGESSDAVAVGDRSRDRKQQHPTKKRRVRRDSTSSSSSPSSSSDSNGSDNDAGKGDKQKPATQPRSENSPPKPQPKAQPAKPAAANARPNASPPVQPPDARHTLSDRQVLFLVVVVGVVCATIGAALAGFLVFRAMDSKLAALLLAQQQQQAPAGAAKAVVGDL
jgi:hypothetical protein